MIAIGSDHAGLPLKEEIIKYFNEKAIEFKDYGTYTKESVDYSDYGRKVALSVQRGECEKGIVICGTGIGISIAANKVKGIRCALCNDVTSAKLTRAHNDANMLSMGAGVIGSNLTMDIVDVFMNTEFSNEEKHVRRLSQLREIETEELK